MPSSSTTQRLIYEVVFQHDHPMAPMRYQCEECGAVELPTPSGKMGLQWVVPVVRCEHREHDYPNGHIDGHFFYDWDSNEVPSAEWCPGAGIGDTT